MAHFKNEYLSVNKSLRFPAIGGEPEVVETAVPKCTANELLVEVRSASVNPVDIQLWRSGLVGVVAGNKGLGRDFAGCVVAVGKDVKGWTEGDHIFGLLFHVFGQGTFSQYITVNPSSDAIAKNPRCFTHEQAATIPLAALTSFACLDWLPSSTASQRRVVIRGASGGTGSWMVQLAKLVYDCHVTAICSGKNAEYVLKLGADEVIDYTTQNVTDTLMAQRAATKENDLIVDCVGGTDLLASYEQLLHPKGAYVTIVGDKTDIKALGGPVTYLTNPAQIIRYIKGYISGPRYACVSFYQKSEYLEKIVALRERGELQTPIQEEIHGMFDERHGGGWKRAVELMESGRVRGKVVLSIP